MDKADALIVGSVVKACGFSTAQPTAERQAWLDHVLKHDLGVPGRDIKGYSHNHPQTGKVSPTTEIWMRSPARERTLVMQHRANAHLIEA